MDRLIDDFPLRGFEDLVGQDEAVRTMSRYVAGGGRRGRFLLYGPYGSGKTSLARITAKALLCQRRPAADGRDPRPASPCNACEDCAEADVAFAEDVDRHRSLRYCDCGIHGDVATIRDIVEWSRYHPPRPEQRVIVVLDEAQELKAPASAALHEILGQMPEHLTFLLVAPTRERIDKPVRDRCTLVRTALLDPAAAESYARSICRAKGFPFEADALEILVDLAGGHARALITSIDSVASEDGRIALDAVRRHFDLGHAAALADYLDAVVGDDFAAQFAALDGWRVEPRAKLAALHRLLTFVFVNDVMGVHRPDRTLADLSADRRAAIVAGFARRAQARRTSPRSLWEETISFWTVDPRVVAREALMERVIRFHGRMNGDAPPAAPDAHGRAVSGGDLPRARRSVGRAAGAGGAASAIGRLTKEEARSVWDAGSFLAREHGLALNVWVRFDHARLGRASHAAGGELVGQFVHELGQALARWSAPNGWEAQARAARPLRWVYVHGADAQGGLVSDVAVHVPAIWRRDLRHWFLGNFLPNKCGAPIGDGAVRLRHHGSDRLPGSAEAAAVRTRAHRRHTQILRLLCRDLDPDLVGHDAEGRRRPLIELIGLRPCLRAPCGPAVTVRRTDRSRTIGPGAQEREQGRGLGPLSPFGDGAWAFLGCGWELVEHRDRDRWRVERERRQAAAAAEERGAALALPGSPPEREALIFEGSWMRRSWATWSTSPRPTLRYRHGQLVDLLDD